MDEKVTVVCVVLKVVVAIGMYVDGTVNLGFRIGRRMSIE